MPNYQQIATRVRRKTLDLIYAAQTSHIGSNLSCVDLLTVLYTGILNIDKDLKKDRDRFVLSKGWAAAANYILLTEKEILPKEALDSYCQPGSPLIGLVERSVRGIEASTGSMGHGLPICVGMALAAKRSGEKWRVFVLMSDGEQDCGTTWESALLASHHKLDNLTAIIDYNRWQAIGRTNEILNLEPLAQKWQSFGWEVREIDGHNFGEIEGTLLKIPFAKDKPSIIIAHTIKGKGVSFMEDKLLYHYKNLSDEEYKQAIRELV